MEMGNTISTFSSDRDSDNVYLSTILFLKMFLLRDEVSLQELYVSELKSIENLPGWSKLLSNLPMKYIHGGPSVEQVLKGLCFYQEDPRERMQQAIHWLWLTREVSSNTKKSEVIPVYQMLGYIAMCNLIHTQDVFSHEKLQVKKFTRSIQHLPHTPQGYKDRMTHVATMIDQIVLSLDSSDDIINDTYDIVVGCWGYIFLCYLNARALVHHTSVGLMHRDESKIFIQKLQEFTHQIIKGDHSLCPHFSSPKMM